MPAIEKPKYILSFDDVRGILGLGPKELRDTTIALKAYAIPVEGAVEAVHVELPELYDTLLTKQEDNSIPLTRTERKVLALTDAYATYYEARLLVMNMQSGALKKITDGKAEAERFPIDFDRLLGEINMVLADLLSRLQQALEDMGLTIAQVPFVYYGGVATLAVDPVTGEQ